MPIRARQRLPHCAASVILLPEVHTNESTGESEIRMVNQADFILPDPAMYDLEAMLKAGVNLKQVNSKILPTTGYNIHAVVESEKEEPSDKGDNE